MTESLKESGNRLFSPGYIRANKSWAILNISIRRLPDWAAAGRPQCVFRQICYLNALGEVEGLGRSWIPLRRSSWPLIRKCYRPIRPLPLGVALNQLWGEAIEIDVRDARSAHSALTRYRETSEKAACFKRVFRRANAPENVVIATEEDLLSNLAIQTTEAAAVPCKS